MKKIHGLVLVALFSLSCSANAALHDRGNGMIYDSDQNITWLQDANYAMTSGYDDDGRMNWSQATAWADGLSFGGYNDWRLVNANPSDTNCSNSIRPPGHDTQYYNYNCTGNELGHLFYIDFGLTQDQPILSSTDDDLDLFINIQNSVYWSGTEYEPDTRSAWHFHTNNGVQLVATKRYERLAWAVRNGDVTPVPLPSALLLFISGIIGIGATRLRRK